MKNSIIPIETGKLVKVKCVYDFKYFPVYTRKKFVNKKYTGTLDDYTPRWFKPETVHAMVLNSEAVTRLLSKQKFLIYEILFLTSTPTIYFVSTDEVILTEIS